MVEITVNLLDCFMLTPLGTLVHQDCAKYQLASLTALYTAVKIHKQAAMDPQLVSRLSRGVYSPKEIVQMESCFISSLQWCLHPPLAHYFVQALLELVPINSLHTDMGKKVEKLCSYQINLSVVASQFLDVKMSTIAYASINNALESIGLDTKLLCFTRHIFSRIYNHNMLTLLQAFKPNYIKL